MRNNGKRVACRGIIIPSRKGDSYADLSQEPLYSFTSYEYGELVLQKENLGIDDTVRAFVSITNTGALGGTEIMQASVSDDIEGCWIGILTSS